MRFTDPTGHRCVEDGFEGSCDSVEKKLTTKWNNDLKSRKIKGRIRSDWLRALEYIKNNPITTCSGSSPGVMCPSAPEPGLPADYTLPDQLQPTASSGDTREIDELFGFWENVVSPFNDGLDLYDVYRLTSSGGWRYSRTSLNFGPLEGIAAGLRQLYRDSWLENTTPTQKAIRSLIAGGEAYATDIASDKMGDVFKAGGLAVGGPPGAVAGKLFGNTLGTRIGDALWSNWVNPLISQTGLGVFP